MALPLYNNGLEALANTTVPTGGSGGNTGGASGDYVDTVTGTTITADSANFANGARSFKIVTATTVAACYFAFTTQLGTLSTNQTLNVRYYYRTPGTPTSSVRTCQILNGTTVLCGLNQGSGTGDMQVRGSADAAVTGGLTGTALAASTWYRIEAAFTGIGSATLGACSLGVYQQNTNTLLGSLVSPTGQNFGTLAPNALRIGITTANASVSSTYNFDDPAFSTTGMPSPPGPVPYLVMARGVPR